jgi:hypothetical protein
MNERLPSQLPRCGECGGWVHPGQVVTFREDGRVRHAHCPLGAALQSADGMLSETAEALLAFLRAISESAACENCAAASLNIDRYSALKAIRELIVNGRIFCSEAPCAVCHEDRIVARLWREPPLS